MAKKAKKTGSKVKWVTIRTTAEQVKKYKEWKKKNS